MKTPSFHLTIKNDLGELDRVADTIDAFCVEQKLGEVVAHALNLAADELLTNTINYGYADDAPHAISIDGVLEDGRVVVVLRDDAQAFDPTGAAEPDVGLGLEERPIGGLGIHLARAMMDDIAYSHVDGRNEVTLTKRIDQ